MKRRKMSKKESRKNFSKGNHINGRNNHPNPMRGGYRL